jgi:hypothetical protein
MPDYQATYVTESGKEIHDVFFAITRNQAIKILKGDPLYDHLTFDDVIKLEEQGWVDISECLKEK